MEDIDLDISSFKGKFRPTGPLEWWRSKMLLWRSRVANPHERNALGSGGYHGRLVSWMCELLVMK